MSSATAEPAIYLVHPDQDERDRLRALFARHDYRVHGFASADALLKACDSGGTGCLVIGLVGPPAHDLLKRLRAAGVDIPAIMIAERSDVPAAVRAKRAGASAYVEKPYAHSLLMREIRRFFVTARPLLMN
jgi:FixJ family two-component response regulator